MFCLLDPRTLVKWNHVSAAILLKTFSFLKIKMKSSLLEPQKVKNHVWIPFLNSYPVESALEVTEWPQTIRCFCLLELMMVKKENKLQRNQLLFIKRTFFHPNKLEVSKIKASSSPTLKAQWWWSHGMVWELRWQTATKTEIRQPVQTCEFPGKRLFCVFFLPK